MTIDELKSYLATFTWAQFELVMEQNPAWNVTDFVDEKDRSKAVHLFINWMNENRTDGGYTQVIWGKKNEV